MKLPNGRMTNGLAIATTVAFVLAWLSGELDLIAMIGGFVPARAMDSALFGDLGLPIAALPFWLTPLSATLIHGGWLHIGMNMLMLLFCGRYVEHVLGPRLLLCLYGIGAYAAAGMEWIFTPDSIQPMVGASGAISALLGTYALLYSNQRVRALGPLSANVVRVLWLAAGWIAIQLMLGVATSGGLSGIGEIAIGAHIGGFLAGLVLTRPMLHWRFRKKPVGVPGQG